MKIQEEVLQLHNETTDILDQELSKVLQTGGYDDFSDEIAILVDDTGFEKSI
ncbi:hypothetical protein [Bacillus sp. JJ1474]|uniref:hypothetical protein n=1 Tax=Bacillus sp. JJ1474 TaxID=3122955 RepID=UPI002FFF9E9E